MVLKDEFNSVGANSVKLCTDPCPPFMILLMVEGCLLQQGVSCPCGDDRLSEIRYLPFNCVNGNVLKALCRNPVRLLSR